MCQFAVELILVQRKPDLQAECVPAIFGLFTALTAIFIILNMPLRKPEMPLKGISTPFSTPTDKLRSPEDNLTLLQFMTFSWLSPLISVGAKRQLNNEDVWDLSYEFQHRYLYDNFRELRGSIVGRLLRANGLDLVITSLLATIETAASA